MDFKTYRQLPAVNFSTLKVMGVSPLHYRHAVERPQSEPSDAMILGSATHKAVLEPDEFGEDFVVWTGPKLPANFVTYEGRRTGPAWTAFQEAHAGTTILTPKEVDAIENSRGTRVGDQWTAFEADAKAGVREVLSESMNAKAWEISAAVRAHPVAAALLGGVGVNEHTIVWTDEATGLKCKGRADRIARDRDGTDVLIDLKTDRDPDPRAFSNTIAKRGYHAQMSFYRDGLRASGYDIGRVVLIVVESSPPYDVGVLELSEDVLYAGQEEYRALLAKVAECRKTNEWPGRFPVARQIDLPGWYWRQAEEDEAGDGLDWSE